MYKRRVRKLSICPSVHLSVQQLRSYASEVRERLTQLGTDPRLIWVLYKLLHPISFDLLGTQCQVTKMTLPEGGHILTWVRPISRVTLSSLMPDSVLKLSLEGVDTPG